LDEPGVFVANSLVVSNKGTIESLPLISLSEVSSGVVSDLLLETSTGLFTLLIRALVPEAFKVAVIEY